MGARHLRPILFTGLLCNFCTTSLDLGILLPDFLAGERRTRVSQQGEYFVVSSVICRVAMAIIVNTVMLSRGRFHLVPVRTARSLETRLLGRGQGGVLISCRGGRVLTHTRDAPSGRAAGHIGWPLLPQCLLTAHQLCSEGLALWVVFQA